MYRTSYRIVSYLSAVIHSTQGAINLLAIMKSRTKCSQKKIVDSWHRTYEAEAQLGSPYCVLVLARNRRLADALILALLCNALLKSYEIRSII